MSEVSIETRVHICTGLKKAGYDVNVIGRVVLAELRQYWPNCFISAEFITHMIRSAFAIYIHTV